MRGKDLIAATLFGGAGGSSGGGGGGSVAVSPKDVNFYDYDGTCVHAYTVAEAQALSALPAGPEHPGLVFQGWNWSLEGVKGLTRAMNIGAMYTTDDGTTRLYITLQEGRTSPMLGVGVNGTVTVDWGDGTEPDVLTGTSVDSTKWTPNHNYAAPGDYVIRLTVDGEVRISGGTTKTGGASLLRYSSATNGRNVLYQNCLRYVQIGSGVSVGIGALYHCCSLSHVTIPNSVTSIGQSAFTNCCSLSHVTIPNNVTSIGQSAFESCLSLMSVTVPKSVTSIGTRAFYYCYTFAHVAIPNSVTSIEANTFYNCNGVAFYDFTTSTAVPTLSNSNAFSGIPADCEIRVPAALYDEWIAATNWATYASQIKAY